MTTSLQRERAVNGRGKREASRIAAHSFDVTNHSFGALFMKPFLPPLLFGALVLVATQSFADDSMHSGAMTTQQHQMMKDCMAQQKAKDSSMSKADMKSACMAQMKSKMDSGQMNSGQMSGDHGDPAKDDQPAGSPTATPSPKQ
jgi:hypothetical protein